jgi:hypothetical protein
MKIPVTSQPLPGLIQRELTTLLQQLKIGQTFPARVLEQLQPGLVRLQIATTALLARTQQPLPTGAQLKLEVIKGMPLPELRILRDPSPRERQQQVVRTAIAQQLPPREVRQAGVQLQQQARPGPQAEAVRQLTAIDQDRGVKLNELSPARLQRALSHSGVLHEARLAAGQPVEGADTKTRLLQLLVLLRPEIRPGEKEDRQIPNRQPPGGENRPLGGDALLNRLVRLIEGSVSRIQLQQAATLPTEEGQTQRQAWQIDLPIHLPDETHDAMLRIERQDGTETGDNAPGWSVKLVFQFDTIGTLQCHIALAGARVSATFWCERDETHRRVEARLPMLQEALEAQGLEVVHMTGVLGDPPEPLIGVPVPERLLDERA